MNKTQNPMIKLNNVYAFVDPTAKGTEKNNFHLFVVGKNNRGMFLHNGAKYSLEELENVSPKIVFYTPTIQTNLYGEIIVSKNFHNAHISNNVAEILNSENFAINGIENNALEAIRPLTREQNVTLEMCWRYENLFSCVQKREIKNKDKQSTLMDFCK